MAVAILILDKEKFRAMNVIGKQSHNDKWVNSPRRHKRRKKKRYVLRR
jgi:hypothetical protein